MVLDQVGCKMINKIKESFNKISTIINSNKEIDANDTQILKNYTNSLDLNNNNNSISNDQNIVSLSEFKDSELVFGLVCACGTDLSLVIESIKTSLGHHDYEVHEIDIADQILNEFKDIITVPNKNKYVINKLLSAGNSLGKNYFLKTHALMDLGNYLRKCNKNLIALAIVNKIRETRMKSAEKKRLAFIIKSLKNEHEVHFLSALYKQGFYMFSVFLSKEERKHKLVNNKKLSEQQALDLIERDANEEDFGFGQHTRDTFKMADFFIDRGDSINQIEHCVERIIHLVFGEPFTTPTFGEYAMFIAYSASLRSADLSRQVGAVICNKYDDIIASGTNDCPKYGGGLYWQEYKEENQKYVDRENGKDYKRGYDSNKREIEKIEDKLLTQIATMFQEITNFQSISEFKDKYFNLFREGLKNTGIRDLTEYGRIVHAEMEALSVCSRNGISCKGAKMYCTTFPCHNCTKHLIASGIEKVVYIEPYPKSKSLELYDDTVALQEKQAEKHEQKLVFVPFFGVGPRRFIELFSTNRHPLPNKQRRKNNSSDIIKWDEENSNVRDLMLPSSYRDRELLYELQYKKILSKILQHSLGLTETLSTKNENDLATILKDISELQKQINNMPEHVKTAVLHPIYFDSSLLKEDTIQTNLKKKKKVKKEV